MPQQPRALLLFGPVPSPAPPPPLLPHPCLSCPTPPPSPAPVAPPSWPSSLPGISSLLHPLLGHSSPGCLRAVFLLLWGPYNPCSPCQAGVWLEGGQPGRSRGSPLAQDAHLGNLDDNPQSGPQGQELWSAGGLCGHHQNTSQRQRWGQGEGWDSLP